MDWISLAGRLVLTAVFVVAGISKLLDGTGTREALGQFGVAPPFRRAAALILPIFELAIAATLMPARSAGGGLLAAAALLLVFTGAVAWNVVRGRRPDCHCFGAIGGGPVGPGTMARNGAFLAIAASAFVIDLSGSRTLSGTAWVTDLEAAQAAGLGLAVIGLAFMAVEGWILLHLVAQNGRLLLRIEALEAGTPGLGLEAILGGPDEAEVGLPVGSPAPTFALPGIHGETATLDSLRAAGKPVLLAFTDPGCSPCAELLPDLARWQREASASATLALISKGSAEENQRKVGDLGLVNLLLQKDREVMQSFGTEATPSMVMVRADGTIGSPVAQGAEQIRSLVARVVGGAAAGLNESAPCPKCGKLHAPTSSAAGLAIGADAPSLRLPDLDGREVDLADYRGRETLVLFWNPTCGFCQQMLPDLKAVEAQQPADAPAIVLVSAGTRDANAAQGLRSTVLLDQSFAAGQAFGAQGTPSAVLIGADGKIASPLTVGAPSVLTLARGEAW